LVFDKRPFKTIEQHDEHIILSHNETVTQEDDFYFLGDFCMMNTKKAEAHLSRLLGNKFFIKGNHDKKAMIKLYEKYGTYLGEQKKVVIHGQDIILNHFAMRIWNRSHHGAYHLYGHSHGNIEHVPYGKSMDVCIILNNYRPFEFDEIDRILSKRDVKLLGDHHTPRTNV
jgi:calcineurin-like phosphoesterase family protein